MTDAGMMKRLGKAKDLLPTSIWSPVRALGTAVLTPIRFSLQTGHWTSSLKRRAISPAGDALPWYTYAAIDFLRLRTFADQNVLEFGGGQSTLWWAQRARSVLTIEENAEWYGELKGRIPANVDLRHVPLEREPRNAAPLKAVMDSSPAGKFDVIVIDGHLREEATVLAFDYLAPGGAIICDNSEGYSFDRLTADVPSCSRVDFYGFAPGVSRRHCTSIAWVGDCFLFRPQAAIVDIEETGY